MTDDYPTWAETPEGRWPQIMEQARMNEMLERVARAIAQARGSWYADEGQWRHCEGEARAAIEAMRYEDGTDETKVIGLANKLRVDAGAFIECIEAWIDAALKEPE